MSTKLDCKQLPCPQPVLKCKNIIESDHPENLEVIVDNEPAKENVSRFLGTRNYNVEVSENNGIFYLHARRSENAQDGVCEECTIMSDQEISELGGKTLVFLDNEFLGAGDDELGEKLMFNFISTLPELGESLWRIIMVNSAVKLATSNHTCLEKLKELEKNGVSILVCGTCLDHFNLLDQKEAGETTNMLDVVTSLQLASKVIKA